MSDIQELVTHFQQSFDDRNLSGSERKALKEVLSESALTKEQRDFLHSQLYEIAEKGLGKGNDRDVLDWLKRSNQLIWDSQTGDKPVRKAKVFFSPGREPLTAIQSAITFAGRHIDICVFTISDDRITDSLIDKHRSGTRIRLITDNEKLFDMGSDIEKIAAAGIPVKVDLTENHMHHKFALFDKKSLLTGSYNWTRSAEARNEENILITYVPHVIHAYQEQFDKMWKEMADFEGIRGGYR